MSSIWRQLRGMPLRNRVRNAKQQAIPASIRGRARMVAREAGLKHGATRAALDRGDFSGDLLCSRRHVRIRQRRGFHRAGTGCWTASDAGASLRSSGPHPPKRTRRIIPRTIGCAWNSDALTCPEGQTVKPSGSFAKFSKLRLTIGWPRLELARALGYGRQFEDSDKIYRELLSANAADEAAAIGLASNLLHQQRSAEARDVVDKALTFHSNSLRLQEYKDRIESGQLGGEERELVVVRNLFEMDVDFVRDTAGNHSWLSSQRVDFGIRPGLTNRLLFDQQFQHSPDDSFEAVETFTEGLRWRPRESLLFTAGGGAVRFNNGDVHAIYETSLAFQPKQHFVLGAGFSRVPITPDAEASEHRLTAQGWETFVSWTPVHWQIIVHGSRQHYSDENIGNRQSAEVIRAVGSAAADFRSGLPISALQLRPGSCPRLFQSG